MEAIYAAERKLALAITLPDDVAPHKSGRVFLDKFCELHTVPLVKSSNINNSDVLTAIHNAKLDYLFIIGWSQIAGDDVVDAPRNGCLGMHPTLLPQGRGRAAIPWAILKGLDKTGVTLFRLSKEVDRGSILGQLEIPMAPDIDATDLYKKVCDTHVQLMIDVLPKLESGDIRDHIQNDALASHWPGRKPEDGAINISGSVKEAERLVRAVTKPYPGAFVIQGNKKLVIWKAAIIDNPADRFSINFYDGTLQPIEFELVNLF
jgi:methionyl-tRNA formyltransferase